MGTVTATISGHGVAALPGVIQPLEIAPKLTATGGLVDFDGPLGSGYERIHHAGWVAVGQDIAGLSPPYLVTWSGFIRYQWESVRFLPSFYADVYMWDLTPGCTVDLEINW